MKKGFIHLIPILVVALGISLISIGAIAKARTIHSPSVLSSANANKENPGNKGQDKSNSNKASEKEEKSNISPNSQQRPESFSKESSKGESQNKEIKNKNEVKQEMELYDEATSDADDDGITDEQQATPSGRKIRTNFPITVNPLTNEKIVTTPSGTKVVILPEVAIQNMIKAGFPVVLPEPSPEPLPSPGEGTPSATPEASPENQVDQGAVTLTEFNGQLVYEIPAIKKQKFLALIPIDIRVIGLVSAESGDLLKIKKSLLDQIIDLLSF